MKWLDKQNDIRSLFDSLSFRTKSLEVMTSNCITTINRVCIMRKLNVLNAVEEGKRRRRRK